MIMKKLIISKIKKKCIEYKWHTFIKRNVLLLDYKKIKILEKKIYTQSHKIYNEDTKLRQDREAFQRQLKEKWENK